MKNFNSPILAILTLSGFLFLAQYANYQPQVVVFPGVQSGYDKGANDFVGLKLAHFNDVSAYHMDSKDRQQAMNELYGDSK